MSFILTEGLLSKLLFIFLRVQSGGNSFPPPLSAERERECFRLMRENGDMSARNELIEHNLRLVAHIVKKYYSSGKNQDDLISIGTIGLIKAVDSFDPALGSRFATYAGKCLQNEILMYFRSQKRLAAEVSLSETIDIDKDGNPLTWGDIIAVDDTIADDLDVKLRSARAIQIINNELTPRERQIISLRYGLGERPAITQREVAALMGISRSYVSRLEGSALKKIGDSLKRYSL
ncbi:MAG TPA: RNA polymerase sporulation sigma factor SigK [Firmicutes bacterium]|nr:RNA polymerase sporulation sigma factor SigK [Bacillota bacterium]